MSSPQLNVVVGVTGGIAAYKAVGVVRGLVLAGHRVTVVPTEAALRFVGRPTWEAISRNPVHTDLYEGVAEVRHVALGQSADLIVIAPATAHFIAKMALGLADDLLGNTVLATTAPVVIAPAMHTEMLQNPATAHNLEVLRQRGVTIVGPESGQLTGNDAGPGRMTEPDAIVEAALAVVGPADLTGRRILISAGGTREPLDPVRFLGNRSSGKQGVALAAAALQRGAEVTLVAAHLDVPAPRGVRLLTVDTAARMHDVLHEEAPGADIVIMAAAVADYRPAAAAETKIKKDSSGAELQLTLKENPDILAGLARSARPDQLIVGFAAETVSSPAELLELGRAKLRRKGCDFLILNAVGWDTGFGAESTAVTVLGRSGTIVGEASGSKMSVAHHILDALSHPIE